MEAESALAAASPSQRSSNEYSSPAAGDSEGDAATAICTRLLAHLLELGSHVASPVPVPDAGATRQSFPPRAAVSQRMLDERLHGVDREISLLLELALYQPYALRMRKNAIKLVSIL